MGILLLHISSYKDSYRYKKMSMTGTGDFSAKMDPERMKELKEFDDMKAGVKGLVDANLISIPKIFMRPPDELAEELKFKQTDIEVPVIDLSDIQKGNLCKEIVEEVRFASEKWGFFQVVNHGIPSGVLNEMIDGVCLFNEQDLEVKKLFYSRNHMQKVRFNSNYDLYKSRFANWRDTLTISLPDHLDPEELPVCCRRATQEYIKHIIKLGDHLFELLSEALGLKADHLKTLGCGEGYTLVCHYYPACPEPQLTLGASKHSDPGTLTILLQSQICSLQVLHEGEWVNIRPIPGALLISNDRLKSVEHRVIANHEGPRISVACFFTGSIYMTYSPIKELTSENNPARYREVVLGEYISKFFSRSLDDKSSLLDYYKQ
ncbi:1-aminocyclopropane-1-carboxylate oxidase homolog 11 isoform X2 [Hevea brasiliensis]|uniref:1-aminocyclopropane-1-carboxylate oxidase homolog 11 isoform X2 n=1 Tax=Hevea brasiliensis TaxID=3981 RepID=UPI0025EBF5E2|nr:1-aminocyclopropane-1-carboxylate oxidase homolog 11 isoform X2 [Hevea brasiliensis]